MYIEMAIHTHQKPQSGERYISTQKVFFEIHLVQLTNNYLQRTPQF